MAEEPTAAHERRPARFMVIAAHPDDADFGPAATAARWIDAGSVGWLVCCTSGDQGGDDHAIDPLALAATREAEQRAAAADRRLRGRLLPAPARRRARERPRAARAPRPRDPHVPSGGGAHPRPGGPLLRGRRREPRRPSRGGDRRGGCRLPGSPQRDVVPGARAGGARPAQGRQAVPVLAEPAGRVGGRDRDARPPDRGPPVPREPDLRTRSGSRSASGRGPPRRASRSVRPRARRSGSSSSTRTRRTRPSRRDGPRSASRIEGPPVRPGPPPVPGIRPPARGGAAGSGPTRATGR